MNKNKANMMIMHTAAELHVREAKEGEKESRTIRGYAIMFNVRSVLLYGWDDEEVYELIEKDAITKELLDSSDIKMTMYHNRELILARSNKGKGTLTYGIDDKGVWFEFEAPDTANGNEALELVRRGDLAGCSFAFRTHYYDEKFVEPEIEKKDEKTLVTYRVKKITDILDFTLAADPAYPDTSCETDLREMYQKTFKKRQLPEEKEKKTELPEVEAARREANRKLYF